MHRDAWITLATAAALLVGSAEARPQATTTVFRDSFGVPHVFGPTDESVVYGAAWVQAEEDWPMVEENFIRAIGRGAEVFGEEALLFDYVARALEIPRLASEEYERSPSRMRRLLEAYAAGFDAWLAAHPTAPRRLLEGVEPWYTLALLRYKYHQLEFLGNAGLRGEWVERLLQSGWPQGGAPAVSPAVSGLGHDQAAGMRFAELLQGPFGEQPLGSNEWAVAPSRTVDGHALLLVNPHQRFFGVERYLEIHLHSDEGLVFSGLTRFGFLLPYMGNSDLLGWTYTDNHADIGDLYVERFDDPAKPLHYRYGAETRTAESWTETVQVTTEEGVVERTLRFWKTHHGPVVGLDDQRRPLSARLPKLVEGGWFAQLDAMIRAGTLEEFRSAVARLDVPYMNLMYADREGNIWYLYGSAVPRRHRGYDWRRPVDGSDPGTEWDGYHPLEELPQVLNPESGWLVNTNSSPFVATSGIELDRADFPPYMIDREEDNPRAWSSRRVLEAHDRLSFDDFARIVWDSRLSLADSLVPAMAAERERMAGVPVVELPAGLRPGTPGRRSLEEAVDRLVAWDRYADVESVATTHFVLAAERLFFDRHASGAPGDWPWSLALAGVLEGLSEIWGRTDIPWGEINRLQRPPSNDASAFADSLPSFPVGGAPGGLGSVFSYHTEPVGTTRRRYGVSGNTFVKVIEFGPEVRGRSVLVFGQSGDPASPHYFDQAALYANRAFKPAWFTREEVGAHAEATYELPPR